MANLTFNDLQLETYDHLGLDSTDVNNQTRVKRWINYSQQDICARWPWPFMESFEQVPTVSDYTTGTVSINTGSTSGTGSGTSFTSTQTGYYIQFKGSNDWYQFTFASGTSFTIDQPYQPSTNASSVTFILRKFYYSLSSSADRIYSIVNWNTPLKLIQIDMRTINDLRPNPFSTNTSYGYTPWGYDSSGNIQIIPYPFPSDNRILQIKTMKRPTDMVASTDAPSLPNKYAHVIAWGAVAVGFGFLRKLDIAGQWNSRYESRISQMKSEYKISEDFQIMFRSIDSVQRSKWIQMPESYPVITSG